MTPEQMAALHAAAMDTRPWSADEFKSLIAGGAVAMGDSRAFALYRVTADEAELLTIATRPDCRRQGLAGSLLHDLRVAATAAGAARIYLEVAAQNAPARALYEMSGYAPIGLRRAYYRAADGQTDDAIVMEKRLAPGLCA